MINFTYKPKLLIFGKDILDDENPVNITINGKEFISTCCRQMDWKTFSNYEYKIDDNITVELEIDYFPPINQLSSCVRVTMCCRLSNLNICIPSTGFITSDRLKADKENGKILENICKDFMEVFYEDITETINTYLHTKEAVTIGLKDLTNEIQ